MPKMALSTGGCDPFGCLFSRMGIDALEFTAPGNGGAIEVFEGVGGGSVAGGGSPKSETSLWNDVESLKKYDVVLLSCECSENDYTKSNANKEAMKQYLDLGGRVFATHFHYTWFKNGPSDLAEVANWNPTWAGATMMTGTVDQSFPKGKAMAEWLLNVGASTAKGSIVLSNLAHDVSTVNSSAQRWIATNLGAANESVKYFSFNTPIGKKPEEQCGRGVMSDLHVSNGESDSNLPSNCTSKTLTAQEKALEFLLFDLSSCIQNESEPPKPPK